MYRFLEELGSKSLTSREKTTLSSLSRIIVNSLFISLNQQMFFYFVFIYLITSIALGNLCYTSE